MSGLGFIAVEPNGKCEECGKIDELRPYGENGKRICFKCGMRNEELVRKRMNNYIFGESLDN